MEYRFFGWEGATVMDSWGLTPRDYYDLLSQIWCAETCAPRMRGDWSRENPTLGQCSITAFLLQDFFGGKVYGVPLGDGNYHCFNVVPCESGECVFDLTSEQFGEEKLTYDNCPEQFREVHFQKEEKRLRYEQLKRMLLKQLQGSVSYRYANKEDSALILSFIRELAIYEKMEDQVVATAELLQEWIFEKQKAEVLFALVEGKEVGFALFFHNFSTFLGRAGIYLEDLFILSPYRGRGIGRGLLQKLAQIALERGCGRLEWWCLDWNQPSIDFYLSLGATPMEEWTTYRLSGDTLRKVAEG